MADQNPSILSHISLGSNRFDEAVAFYDQVLAYVIKSRLKLRVIRQGKPHTLWLIVPDEPAPPPVPAPEN